MQLGDCIPEEREQRSPMEKALDTLDAAVTDLINTTETTGLDQLENHEQVALWQRSNASATNSRWLTTA